MALPEELQDMLESVSETLDESENFDSVGLHGQEIIITNGDQELILRVVTNLGSDDEDDEDDEEDPEIRGLTDE